MPASTIRTASAREPESVPGCSLVAIAERLPLALGVMLATVVLSGCWGSDEDRSGDGARAAAKPVGKALHGETETGMKLEVETFVDPASDSRLAEIDAYRAQVGMPEVDYHRVTADNSDGELPDTGRTVVFATDIAALQGGDAVQTRFVCDALNFEWPPPPRSEQVDMQEDLLDSMCAENPSQPQGIEPGESLDYYLLTDRGFEGRGIEQMRVFGPLNVELVE